MGLQKAENGRKSFRIDLRQLPEKISDYIICVYLILMLAVFPFYNEEGYSHIGTDKSVFFRRVSVGMGKILLIPLVLCLAVRLVNFVRRIAALGKDDADGHTQKLHIRVSLTDIFAMIYCGALLLSYVFSDFPFGLKFVNAGYISTIGNINWYCGYAVSVVFAGAVLLWLGEGTRIWQRAFLMIYTAVGYMSLVLQGSDSGLVSIVMTSV